MENVEEPFYRGNDCSERLKITTVAKCIGWSTVLICVLFFCFFIDYYDRHVVVWVSINAAFMLSAAIALVSVRERNPTWLIPYFALLIIAFSVASVATLYCAVLLVIANAEKPTYGSYSYGDRSIYGLSFLLSAMTMPFWYIALDVMRLTYLYLRKLQKSQRPTTQQELKEVEPESV